MLTFFKIIVPSFEYLNNCMELCVISFVPLLCINHLFREIGYRVPIPRTFIQLSQSIYPSADSACPLYNYT